MSGWQKSLAQAELERIDKIKHQISELRRERDRIIDRGKKRARRGRGQSDG